MKLEHLNYFLTVAQTGSMHKAAEKHFLTPQNLGLIIKTLEKETGEKLFVRTAQGTQLTAEGEKLVPYAREAVNAMERYFAEKKSKGRILPIYTTLALAKNIRSLQERTWGNGYYISVQSKSRDDLLNLLQKKTEGIYFLPMEQRDRQLLDKNVHAYTIFSETESMRVCHRSNSILQHDIITPELLEQYLLIQEDSILGDSQIIYVEDIAMCKNLMRDKEAIYNTSTRGYQRFFAEEQDWVILQRLQIPTIEHVLVFNLLCEKRVETELVNYIKRKNFQVE